MGTGFKTAALAGLGLSLTSLSFEAPISPQVLEALPAEARDQACLCPRCAGAQGADAKPD